MQNTFVIFMHHLFILVPAPEFFFPKIPQTASGAADVTSFFLFRFLFICWKCFCVPVCVLLLLSFYPSIPILSLFSEMRAFSVCISLHLFSRFSCFISSITIPRCSFSPLFFFLSVLCCTHYESRRESYSEARGLIGVDVSPTYTVFLSLSSSFHLNYAVHRKRRLVWRRMQRKRIDWR